MARLARSERTRSALPSRQLSRFCYLVNSDMVFGTHKDSHHGPGHSRDLVGERDGGNLRGPPRQQCLEPRPMLGAMDLGVADDGERAGHEQAAQIAVTLLADIAKPVLASTRVLLRHDTDPGREVAP